MIGKLGELRDCDTLNEEHSLRDRTVLVVQRRTMGDLPSKSRQALLELGATADYILIGNTVAAAHPVVRDGNGAPEGVGQIEDHLGAVRGRIYVVPRHQDSALRLAAEQLIQRFRLLVRRAHKDARGKDALTIRAMLETELQAALERGLWLPSAEFVLYRTGETRFWCDREDINPGHRTLVDDTPPLNMPLPADPHQTFAPRLCAQLYYFLKDITHRHYHHDNSADNILPLSPASAEDDLTWRRETLYALARAVLEKRRQNALRAYRQAEGILAYCNAFQGLLAPIHRANSDYQSFRAIADRSPYDFQTLRDSIVAGYNEQAWNRSSNLQVAAVILSILVALPPLWLAALSTRDAVCLRVGESSSCGVDIAAWALNLTKQLLEHPGWGAFLFALILFGLFTWASEGFRENPAIRAFTRPFNRLRQSATVSLGNRWRLKGKLDPYGDAYYAMQLILFFGIVVVLTLMSELLGITDITSWLAALRRI